MWACHGKTGLKRFLKKNVDANTDTLAVLDAKLGSIVKEKLGIQCINKCVQLANLQRGVAPLQTSCMAAATEWQQPDCGQTAAVCQD